MEQYLFHLFKNHTIAFKKIMINYFNKVQWITFYLRDDYELKNHCILNWQLYLYVCTASMFVYSFRRIAELKMSTGKMFVGQFANK